MKKLTLLLVLTCCLGTAGFNHLNAQYITNMQMYPAAPNSNEPVSVIVSTLFTSGDCILTDYSVTIDNLPETPVVNVWATYCMGMLTVICERTDTIPLGLLPSGIYILQFQLQYGLMSGPATCIPPFMPGASENLTFDVLPAFSYGLTNLTLLNTQPVLTSDTLWVVADFIFPSAPCELDSMSLNTDPASGNYVLNTFYCLGPLDVICTQTDTFAIYPPHNPGTYSVLLNVESCDGFVTDSGSVNVVIEIPDNVSLPDVRTQLTLPSNFSDNGLLFNFAPVSTLQQMPAELIIYSSDGSIAAKVAVPYGVSTLFVPLPPGFYVYRLQQNGKPFDRGKAFVY
ncbi:hypothetical protein C7N43_15670 [Sphingobacteriales bacterium UPWRP_1]|nr:hypothetical protein C7N43_15670 [Sphingobacteriales bacterium UPWRP_1]